MEEKSEEKNVFSKLEEEEEKDKVEDTEVTKKEAPVEKTDDVEKEATVEEAKTKVEEEKPKPIPEPESVTEETPVEKIEKVAKELYENFKQKGEVFITLVDKNKNFWNSGDELHFYVMQGRCKEMPEEMTDILAHALSDENRLLREATDSEIIEEMKFRAKEELINLGVIKPSKINKENLVV